VRVRAARHRPQRVLGDWSGGRIGDHLLRQHVQRRHRHQHLVERARSDGANGGRRLHGIIARYGKQDALQHAADAVSGAPDALRQIRDRARHADVADEVDVSDVDAQLERRGHDDR